ncbi:hypothetical protein, partial [Micromonospora sp. AMSO31t]|uniref:hypothetical protein n=1 Tax=Micromonospora sp. AMSO31t TaxID=2650566 RepID=UPI00124AEE6E
LERSFPRPRTADAVAHNLPTQVTSFVGRQAERSELRRLVEAYPDGVWFVDVAAVTDPGLVAFEIAAVLGLRPEPGRPMV